LFLSAIDQKETDIETAVANVSAKLTGQASTILACNAFGMF
jgi:hypothetical protein